MKRSVNLVVTLIAALAGGSVAVIPQQAASGSQYAVKVVCGGGVDSTIVQPGRYNTAINVHNPGPEAAPFRYKVALAGVRADGRISGFVDGIIGPDGVQVFTCRSLSALAGASSFDGFFVIETNYQFDVVTYYTAGVGSGGVRAIDVETTPRREIADVGRCRSNVRIPLDDPASWAPTVHGTPVAVTTGSGAWATGPWMSYAADARPPNSGNAVFTFRLEFCSCAPSGGRFANATVRSDNGANGGFSAFPSQVSSFSTGLGAYPSAPSGTGNYSPILPSAAVAVAGSFTGVGNNSFVVQLFNDHNPMGVMMTGDLVLDSGYLGRCVK
ncbi:MAG: hypothetical protein JWR84_3798 [Caulobacter sp.]|nr:hypothetical protein [Caulobacter sp.]